MIIGMKRLLVSFFNKGLMLFEENPIRRYYGSIEYKKALYDVAYGKDLTAEKLSVLERAPDISTLYPRGEQDRCIGFEMNRMMRDAVLRLKDELLLPRLGTKVCDLSVPDYVEQRCAKRLIRDLANKGYPSAQDMYADYLRKQAIVTGDDKMLSLSNEMLDKLQKNPHALCAVREVAAERRALGLEEDEQNLMDYLQLTKICLNATKLVFRKDRTIVWPAPLDAKRVLASRFGKEKADGKTLRQMLRGGKKKLSSAIALSFLEKLKEEKKAALPKKGAFYDAWAKHVADENLEYFNDCLQMAGFSINPKQKKRAELYLHTKKYQYLTTQPKAKNDNQTKKITQHAKHMPKNNTSKIYI